MRNLLQYVDERLAKLRSQLPFVPRALRLVWAAAPAWTVASAALVVVQGLLPVAQVYLTKAVVDSLVATVQGAGEVRLTLALAVGMGLLMLAAEAMESLAALVRTAQAELVQDHVQALIHEQAARVDLSFYDWPEFYDHLHRARTDASYRPVQLIDAASGMARSALTLVAMGAVLLRFGWWVPVLLLAGTAPALLVVLRHTVRQHEWRRRRTPDERAAWYYDWLLTDRGTAAEMRLFDLSGHFRDAYNSVRTKLRTERLRLIRDQALAKTGAGVLGLVVMGGAMLWMLWQAISGRVTLGDVALFFQAFQKGLQLMRSLLGNAGELYTNILFLGNLFEYLDLDPGVVNPAAPRGAPAVLREGIAFRGVRFRYPGGESLALDGLDLTVAAGQIAAVVGPNGAGKSTLIRLLCRFYDPEEGRVELDGCDIRGYKMEELRRVISVMFQRPVQYNARAAENIRAGNWRNDEPGHVERAGEAAEADSLIRRLPEGYATMLGKWFLDGTELSVGEWQRIALARTYYRGAALMLLDEPTSAMDPWAEANWMQRFRRQTAGGTALVMTHRLTTAKFADTVHVMREGRVVESGSHGELLRRDGMYAQAWSAQGQFS